MPFSGLFLSYVLLLALTALTGCGPSGPDSSDMAGCAVRSGGPAITTREVADCAVWRAEKDEARSKQ
jgi:hypothetical protein